MEELGCQKPNSQGLLVSLELDQFLLTGWNGVPEDQCTGQYGCCYSAASSTVGNSGAELALPACFKYNTGGSTYSLAGPANGGGEHCTWTHSAAASTVLVCVRLAVVVGPWAPLCAVPCVSSLPASSCLLALVCCNPAAPPGSDSALRCRLPRVCVWDSVRAGQRSDRAEPDRHEREPLDPAGDHRQVWALHHPPEHAVPECGHPE